jgi:basic amino acid/polyamine antiporter, APA family
MAVALVMGNMIGSGIFLLPASLAPYRGLGLVGWVVSAGGALALAAVFCRLAHVHPAAGGPYAYTRAAFGDLAAFLVAWGYWISVATALGALAVAGVSYLAPFLPILAHSPVTAALTALAAIWVLALVNVSGLRAAGWTQAVTTVLKLLPLALVGLLGLSWFDASHFTIPEAEPRAVLAAIPAVTALTLWAFLGLESATVPAGAIRDPAATIPRATLVGTLLTAVVYIVSTIGVMSTVRPDALAASTAPFADAARTIAGEGAAAAVALGAAISCLGALNGWTLVAGQLPLAVARTGLLPAVFGRVSTRGTPVAGIVAAALFATALVTLNYTRGLVDLFTFFILLSTLCTLVPYAFCSLAVYLMPDDQARRPLSTGGAVVAAVAFGYSLWAMGGAGQETVYWGFLLLVAGLPVYVLVVRTPRAVPPG